MSSPTVILLFYCQYASESHFAYVVTFSVRRVRRHYQKDMGICGFPLILPEFSDDKKVWFPAFPYRYKKVVRKSASLYIECKKAWKTQPYTQSDHIYSGNSCTIIVHIYSIPYCEVSLYRNPPTLYEGSLADSHFFTWKFSQMFENWWKTGLFTCTKAAVRSHLP